jgi:HK97 gp10 family phage protein
MKVTVKVQGLEGIEAALSQFNTRKRRDIARKALDSAGQITARVARSMAPVDEGNLRESIDVSGTLTRRQAGLHTKRAEVERFIGPGAHPQAHLREFGGDGNPPHPYMRPAWDSTKNQVLDRITDVAWLEIEKAIQAKAKRAARGK